MSARELPDWLDGFLKFTHNTEPPDSYRLWCGISVIASVLQRKCKLPWGSLTFYPNLYIVLVGPAGRARKGTAMSPAQKLLEDLGIKMAAESMTRESLIQALAETSESIQTEEGKIMFHSSLTIFSPELVVFLGHNNHQLLMDLTDWYDCRSRWTYRTKNMGTDEITGVFVNLLGATTPELIRTSLPLDAIGGGLTSRIIFVYEERKGKIVAAPMLSKEEVELQATLRRDLERIYTMRGEFRVTQTFFDRWCEWYTAQEENPPFNDPRFAGYIERRPNHIMKLCMVLNASRTDSMIIDLCDIDRAIRILNFTERKMTRTFSGVGKSENADVIQRVMTEVALRKSITFAQLLEMFYYDADKRVLTGIVDTLESMDYIRKLHRSGEMIIEYKPKPDEDASAPI